MIWVILMAIAVVLAFAFVGVLLAGLSDSRRVEP